MVLECRIIHHYEIGLHTQFIGEILDVKVDQDMLDDAGNADIEKIKPIIYAPGLQTYHGVGPLLGKAFKIGKDL
jgi:flavin reductase (DIM6/NTAB) family NADH-FMN oxidoreductase RutF